MLLRWKSVPRRVLAHKPQRRSSTQRTVLPAFRLICLSISLLGRGCYPSPCGTATRSRGKSQHERMLVPLSVRSNGMIKVAKQ